MNYFWTIQSKKTVTRIDSEGCYYPSIKHLTGSYENEYKIVLDSFNKYNKSAYEGLIFGFAKRGDNKYFESIDELYTYFMKNPAVTDAFRHWDNQHVIMQLSYTEEFNMIPIDFNDFISIMPPIMDMNAYRKIITFINNGVNTNGCVLPSFTQIHTPFIKKENIIKIYENFDKRKSDRERKLIVFPL